MIFISTLIGLSLAVTASIPTALYPDSAISSAPSEVKTSKLLESLEGEWTGTLRYRDYQSDQWQTLAMTEDCELFDNQSLICRTSYQEPTYKLHELSVLQLLDSHETLLSTTYAEDGPFSLKRGLRHLEVKHDGSWSATLESREHDDGRLANIRIHVQVTATEQVRKKEVVYVDDPHAEVVLRNEIRLHRAPSTPNVAELVGRWTVDLRPSPDSAPYYQTLRVEQSLAGDLSASFYDSEVEHFTLNSEWNELRCSFVTSDGTGEYHTSFVLDGDTLVGTTHSLGRGFLSRWTAVKAR